MTPDQIALVRSSFVHALPVSDAVATDFYDRLFGLAPHLRSLFKADMAEQRQKLMLTLAMIVRNLDRLDLLLPQATEMARRHVRYGAQEAHYALVGTALIETLRGALAARFTSEVEAAWGMAYATLAGAMIESTKQAA